MWKKVEVKKVIEMFKNGDSLNKMAVVVGKTRNAVYRKLIRLGYNVSSTRWTEKEIDMAIELFKKGWNFKQIGQKIKKSQDSVTKKLNRLGYKYWDADNKEINPVPINKGKSKYKNLDWDIIQKEYEDGMSQSDLIKKYNFSYQALKWGKDNDKIKFRNNSDSVKLAVKQGKIPSAISSKDGIERYRQLCKFKFNLKDYPDKFDFNLIEKYGWYKAKNRGDNLGGVSRDHMYSVREGFKNNVFPEIIGHPANCKLMIHSENNKKKTKSSITLEGLYERIKKFKMK